MSDDVETETSKPRRPLTLRRTEKGAVKQSFSHGRSKTVVVETKKRRVLSPKKGDEAPAKADAKEAPEKKTAPKKLAEDKDAAAKAAAAKAAEDKKKGAVLRTLSDDEKQARAQALAKARKEKAEREKREAAERAEREAREAEERARLEEERRRQAIEEEKRAREAEERRQAEEAAREALEEEERERKKRNAAKTEARAKGREDEDQKADASKDEADNPLAQLGQGLVVTAGLKIPEGFDQRADAEKLNLSRLKFRWRH